MPRRSALPVVLCLLLALPLCAAPAKSGDAKAKAARAPRVHAVVLGSVRKEAYSQAGDPEGAQPGETELKVRPLVVDGRVRDWTTGEAHDVTERSFTVRRALRINDSLPGDKAEHWVWQRGPWVLVDRTAGHIVALKLADYNPAVSDVAWFRDYAAYCGTTTAGKTLYAVVTQLAVRKPLLVKKLAPWSSSAARTTAACAPAAWQREPLQVTFTAAGAQPASFPLTPGSAVLVEAGDDDDAAPSAQ